MINSNRRLIIRLLLVALWIGLGVFLFIVYRGHTILIDNRNVTEPELRAPNMITVTMDGKKSMDFFRGDRDIFKMSGSRHLIRVDFSDGTPPFETFFKLPLRPDVFLLSIPNQDALFRFLYWNLWYILLFRTAIPS